MLPARVIWMKESTGGSSERMPGGLLSRKGSPAVFSFAAHLTGSPTVPDVEMLRIVSDIFIVQRYEKLEHGKGEICTSNYENKQRQLIED